MDNFELVILHIEYGPNKVRRLFNTPVVAISDPIGLETHLRRNIESIRSMGQMSFQYYTDNVWITLSDADDLKYVTKKANLLMRVMHRSV